MLVERIIEFDALASHSRSDIDARRLRATRELDCILEKIAQGERYAFYIDRQSSWRNIDANVHRHGALGALDRIDLIRNKRAELYRLRLESTSLHSRISQ